MIFSKFYLKANCEGSYFRELIEFANEFNEQLHFEDWRSTSSQMLLAKSWSCKAHGTARSCVRRDHTAIPAMEGPDVTGKVHCLEGLTWSDQHMKQFGEKAIQYHMLQERSQKIEIYFNKWRDSVHDHDWSVTGG